MSQPIPKWLQTERREAFEGHLNAYEVSLLCREAEESAFPFLYEASGGDNQTIDDDVNQNTAQYLQVTSIPCLTCFFSLRSVAYKWGPVSHMQIIITATSL